MYKTVIVIPARYQSSRLPGKPLIDINGKPMLQHVLEAAHKVRGVNDIVVATDDDRIVNAVQAWGYNAVMTSVNHQSGTDRLIEVSHTIDADIYVNLQGDEPLINTEDVSALVELMQQQPEIECASMCHVISDDKVDDINSVKVVLSRDNTALYFSRSTIPFKRENTAIPYYKHVGVYAYRSSLLRDYPIVEKDSLELTESLEQLRLLYEGKKIHMLKVQHAYPGVDTKDCVEKVRQILSEKTKLA